MNLHNSDLLAEAVQIIYGLERSTAYRTHSDYHSVCVRRAMVVEQLVITACYLIYLIHVILNNTRDRVVETVICLTDLEIYIRILHCCAEHRVLGVERVGTEFIQRVIIYKILEIFIIYRFDLGYLMRGPEPVEEMHERNLSLDRRKMRDSRKVHDFLHAAR